ncbi:MAG: bifunctional precorrin-2 dehydrogenase/sirohydrochlorin ferrochelatase [Nitrososphaerota archaeon]
MPFFIELSNKTILIIGGGREGAKRAEKYSKTGGRVIVYSRSFDEKIVELGRNGFIELVEGDVDEVDKLEEFIKSSDIVMVTLDTEEYNDLISRIARKHKSLLNLANNAEGTDVVVPIDSSVGPFRIAVTTEGRSSMVAREALQRIVNYLSGEQELVRLAEMIHEVKRIVRRSISDPETRMKIYYQVYHNDDLRNALRSGSVHDAERILRNILRKYGLEIKGIRENE